MTIIIDATVLWWLLGIAGWCFLGVWGLLMGNAAVSRHSKWDMWWPVILGGPITFIVGGFFFFFTDWR